MPKPDAVLVEGLAPGPEPGAAAQVSETKLWSFWRKGIWLKTAGFYFKLCFVLLEDDKAVITKSFPLTLFVLPIWRTNFL